jgi:hypothetical protein
MIKSFTSRRLPHSHPVAHDDIKTDFVGRTAHGPLPIQKVTIGVGPVVDRLRRQFQSSLDRDTLPKSLEGGDATAGVHSRAWKRGGVANGGAGAAK